ncbi:APC membrane recruitment protein 3 [Crotalus tigris]|uniref:APC membrane recruitment protein 3 n=1 Tax=Crotalus tigris TaxID=88082 RepID=UPI00192F3FCA|nr:APC membrane recruitment protein 3 [Crotalus tigris]
MEFKRGKTFIKSGMHLTHEKLPLVHLNPREKDNVKADIKEKSKPDVEIQKATFSADKNGSFSRLTKTGSSESILLLPQSFYKPVRKSKTHDCVLGGINKIEPCSYTNENSEEDVLASEKSNRRLVNSASFSGLGNTQYSSGKKESVVNSSHFLNSPQQMIDYRNFVPQMPFVPAVAKSIPRKRISLKRSKKGFRDIFHIKKNKPENVALFSEKQKRAFPGYKSELAGKFGKYLFKAGETFSTDFLAQDLSDCELQSESSYEYSSTLCEDVASLKSFDSLTGCGEIFADESSAHMELEVSKEILFRQSHQKENPAMGSFQGGVEQLASPAQNEAADFSKLWDNINKSVQLHQKTLFDRSLLKIPSSELEKAKKEAKGSVADLLSSPDSSKDSSIDTGTPKSDNQESMSTSDEGYYDSFTPGHDDEIREVQSPGTPTQFPRDSYSGDALYELFYDPNEDQISPVLDDDLCFSESISEKAVEIPLSIYSFHVGSEENMASQPTIDIISQGFLHSTWKGKECLLKLCDTELSLTMGIINWLRKKPGLFSPQEFPNNPQTKMRKDDESVSQCIPDFKENKSNPGASSTDSKSEIQIYSVEKIEHDQKDIHSCSFLEREENVNAMSELIINNGIPGDRQRVEDSWDDLLVNSSEMKVFLSEECTDISIESLPLEVSNEDSVCHIVMDNHDAESCSSYMTAATSPDSLEPEDDSESKNESWSVECKDPTEPLSFSHSQVPISETSKENNTNPMQLLEHCVTQVASLKIGYDSKNKPFKDKGTGNEMSNDIAQFKKHPQLQNEHSDITPRSKNFLGHHANQYNVQITTDAKSSSFTNQKENIICSEDEKNLSILDRVGQITKNKLMFEYAQLNSQALSYIKDFRVELNTQNSSAMSDICRPTFLPFFSSICSDSANQFSQSFCKRFRSLGKHSYNQGIIPAALPFNDYSKLHCKVLPQVASLSLSKDDVKERTIMEKNQE